LDFCILEISATCSHPDFGTRITLLVARETHNAEDFHRWKPHATEAQFRAVLLTKVKKTFDTCREAVETSATLPRGRDLSELNAVCSIVRHDYAQTLFGMSNAQRWLDRQRVRRPVRVLA